MVVVILFLFFCCYFFDTAIFLDSVTFSIIDFPSVYYNMVNNRCLTLYNNVYIVIAVCSLRNFPSLILAEVGYWMTRLTLLS